MNNKREKTKKGKEIKAWIVISCETERVIDIGLDKSEIIQSRVCIFDDVVEVKIVLNQDE